METVYLVGVGIVGWLIPEFFSALSRGTVRFPVLLNVASAFASVVIVLRFL